MNLSIRRVIAVASAIAVSAAFVGRSSADPLPGRDLLKFTQKPMIATPIINSQGQLQTFLGHDELSTAYGFGNAASPPQDYQGRFMADDFGDKLSSPVVHVKWWGSYHNDFINPQMPVNKFLIAFESDVPSPPGQFSTPGQVLDFDVVNRAAALTPGSGLFTEKLIRGPDALFNESLYEYNAELHFNQAFAEQKDTVYWLKIAALIDAPPGITFTPYAPPPFVTQWGWHNRDYTIKDTLASNIPGPGEFIDGNINGVNIWHFQDDSVQGDMRFLPFAPTPLIFQNNMSPQFYVDVADGPGATTVGVPGIGSHSKDLAFELYTTQVPEPATCLSLAVVAVVFRIGRRRRGA